MISAIVLATGEGRPPERVAELATRSLTWLVSAVVGGVVRDVVFACPRSWPVAEIMDQAGCALVLRDGEAARLREAASLVKSSKVLVLAAGWQPQGPLAEEIDAAEHRLDADGQALLLRAPATLAQRLFPDRAPAAGLILAGERLAYEGETLAALVRGARGASRLRTRVVPVL